MNLPLFFIALLPDEGIAKEITDFKHDCTRLANACHALKSPPHLTLVPPFAWPHRRLRELTLALASFARGIAPFEVVLHDFDHFGSRVIFVGVPDNPALEAMQSALLGHLEKEAELSSERGRRFHPHVTIAHRDLKPSAFPMAWAHFSKMEYRRTFYADRLVLLEHVKGRWEVGESFDFEAQTDG